MVNTDYLPQHLYMTVDADDFSDYLSQMVLRSRKFLFYKGGLTTRFDPPPNDLRELKLHRSSTNVCTKTKMFLKIFFDIRFRSEGA